jgi:integrase
MSKSLLNRATATPRVTVKNMSAYWEPSRTLRAGGFKGRSLGPLSPDNLNEADRLNTAADHYLETGRVKRTGATTISDIFARYLASPEYAGIAATTQRHYARHIKNAGATLGDEVASQLSAARIRKWHRAMYQTSERDAYNHFGTLRSVLEWASDNDLIGGNPAKKVTVAKPKPRHRVATRDEFWAMVRTARDMGRPSVAAGAILLVTTMQRPGDTVSLEASQIQDGVLYLTQSKTGLPLSFMLHPVAFETLNPIGKAGPLIVSETTRTAYSERAWERAWSLVREAAAEHCPSLLGRDAGVLDPTLQGVLRSSDLRRSGMVWAAEHGAGIPDICSVSGHSLKGGMDILETYLPRQRMLADRAVAKQNLVKTPALADIGAAMLAM